MLISRKVMMKHSVFKLAMIPLLWSTVSNNRHQDQRTPESIGHEDRVPAISDGGSSSPQHGVAGPNPRSAPSTAIEVVGSDAIAHDLDDASVSVRDSNQIEQSQVSNSASESSTSEASSEAVIEQEAWIVESDVRIGASGQMEEQSGGHCRGRACRANGHSMEVGRTITGSVDQLQSVRTAVEMMHESLQAALESIVRHKKQACKHSHCRKCSGHSRRCRKRKKKKKKKKKIIINTDDGFFNSNTGIGNERVEVIEKISSPSEDILDREKSSVSREESSSKKTKIRHSSSGHSDHTRSRAAGNRTTKHAKKPSTKVVHHGTNNSSVIRGATQASSQTTPSGIRLPHPSKPVVIYPEVPYEEPALQIPTPTTKAHPEPPSPKKKEGAHKNNIDIFKPKLAEGPTRRPDNSSKSPPPLSIPAPPPKHSNRPPKPSSPTLPPPPKDNYTQAWPELSTPTNPVPIPALPKKIDEHPPPAKPKKKIEPPPPPLSPPRSPHSPPSLPSPLPSPSPLLSPLPSPPSPPPLEPPKPPKPILQPPPSKPLLQPEPPKPALPPSKKDLPPPPTPVVKDILPPLPPPMKIGPPPSPPTPSPTPPKPPAPPSPISPPTPVPKVPPEITNPLPEVHEPWPAFSTPQNPSSNQENEPWPAFSAPENPPVNYESEPWPAFSNPENPPSPSPSPLPPPPDIIQPPTPPQPEPPAPTVTTTTPIPTKDKPRIILPDNSELSNSSAESKFKLLNNPILVILMTILMIYHS